MSPWRPTEEPDKHLTLLDSAHRFSQEDHNILTPLTSLRTPVSIKVPLKCQQDPTWVPGAEGTTRGQGVCPGLVREAVPRGGRGGETPGSHGEPEYTTSSTSLSPNRNADQCSVCD